MVEVERAVKAAPASAMQSCKKPVSFAVWMPVERWLTLDGEGRVNAITEYTTTEVVSALGDCNTRHEALVAHNKELER